MVVRKPLAKGDDGSTTRYTPRKPCPDCGLEHRKVCPSSPAVAAVLNVPTPEPVDYTATPCEWDE